MIKINNKWRHTKEEKRKISIKLAGDNNPMKRKEVRDKNFATNTLPEVRKRRAEISKEVFQRPGEKEKLSRGIILAWERTREMRVKECHWNWQGGIGEDGYGREWTESLRRKIRERDNYICVVCYKWGNHVHHIDHNKENCEETNLITTCPGCNIRAEHNKEHWQIFFTKIIEKKYNLIPIYNNLPQ